MKIDCPHCGVHGSVDNSLLDKKLRCPTCSKVFLVTEEILPEFDDSGMLSQEILHDKQQSPDLSAEDDDLLAAMGEDASADEGVGASDGEELLGLMADDSEDNDLEAVLDAELADEDLDFDKESVELETCSSCGESLHPAFLETVGFERLCALCIPDENLEFEDETDLELTEAGEIEEIDDIDIQLEDELSELDGDSSIQLLVDDDTVEEIDEEEVEVLTEDVLGEDEDLGEYPKEPCSVCGEEFHRAFMQEIDSKLYCGVCQPEVLEEASDNGEAMLAAGAAAVAGAAMAAGDDDVEIVADESETDVESFETGSDFTVGELIKEAWQKTKGVKASVWGAVITMLVIISGVFFGGMAAFQAYYKGLDPNVAMGANCGVQLVANWLSMLMTGGIMLIGVRHVLEQRVSWKMVFAGFSKAFSMTMAFILQTILVTIGFILLVIPGIYLFVGYILVLPLILDKGMGPWEALEASRKAIHKKWWTVFGLCLVMVLISIVAMIPLGLGLIWTIPMFFVLTGVLYVRLFGSDTSIEEDLEEELEDIEDELEEDVEEKTKEKVEENEDLEKVEEISEEIESKK